jgi:hypothetical protein
MKVIQKKRGYNYRYKYTIKPRIEEIEKLRYSLFEYEFYNIKIKIKNKNKTFYLKLGEEFSYFSNLKYSKEDIICVAQFIKDVGFFFIIKEEEIDFDFIEEIMKNAGSI